MVKKNDEKEKKEKKKASDILDMSPEQMKKIPIQERFLRYAMAYAKDKEIDLITADQVDSTVEYLYVPDLGMQWALSRPGFATPRVMTILGKEGSSKSSFIYWLINLVQQTGGLAGLVETENAANSKHMHYYIKDHHKILMPKAAPDTLEEALDYMREFLRIFKEVDPDNEQLKICAFDSVGGTATERAMEEDHAFGDNRVGGRGLVMTDAVDILKNLAKASNTLLVFGNQAKDIIDTSSAAKFAGNKPEYDKISAPGGRKLWYESTYLMYIKKGGALRDKAQEGSVVGNRDGFSVSGILVKNKMGQMYREYAYDIRVGETLLFIDNTLAGLSMGKVLGTDKRQGRYWATEAGIKEDDRMPAEEFYKLIHTQPYLAQFQQALGVDMTAKKIHYPKNEQPAVVTESVPAPSIPPSA